MADFPVEQEDILTTNNSIIERCHQDIFKQVNGKAAETAFATFRVRKRITKL
jgi:hypothetical protein